MQNYISTMVNSYKFSFSFEEKKIIFDVIVFLFSSNTGFFFSSKKIENFNIKFNIILFSLLNISGLKYLDIAE